MRPFVVIAVTLLPMVAQEAGQHDRYPEIRALMREAELAAVNIQFLKDRSEPSSWAARLYGRAGYLEDAARALGNKPDSAGYFLWRARVLYGDLAGAEQSLAAIADPERKAGAMASLADLLWKMGDPTNARSRFEAARELAPKIVNPDHRKRLLATIEQGLMYVSEDPPYRISAMPRPQKRFQLQGSPIPLFPITTDGFRDLDSEQVAHRVSANGEFMTKLYGRMEAHDRDGLFSLAESAGSPFQYTLGMAAIEHILIQAGLPEDAELYANKIPEQDSDCSLAKAEALSAAGAAWLRTGESERAHNDFEAAIRLVKSVTDLPLGKSIGTCFHCYSPIQGRPDGDQRYQHFRWPWSLRRNCPCVRKLRTRKPHGL